MGNPLMHCQHPRSIPLFPRMNFFMVPVWCQVSKGTRPRRLHPVLWHSMGLRSNGDAHGYASSDSSHAFVEDFRVFMHRGEAPSERHCLHRRSYGAGVIFNIPREL